jgi:hypothetical protein
MGTYKLKPSSTQVNEGDILTTTLSTIDVITGTTLYYRVIGKGINAKDFSSGALKGTLSVGADGTATLTHALKNDSTTEGSESLTIQAFSDKKMKNLVGQSDAVTIADTSKKAVKGGGSGGGNNQPPTDIGGTTTDTGSGTPTSPAIIHQTFTSDALSTALSTGTAMSDYGSTFAQYIQKSQQPNYAYLGEYFTSLTGKTFAAASNVLEPILASYQNTRALLYKISSTLFLGVADLSSNQPNYGEPEAEFLYDTSAKSGLGGKAYTISPLYHTTSTYDNNVKATSPVNPSFVFSQQGNLYAVKAPKAGEGTSGTSEIYCYTLDGIATNGGPSWTKSNSNSYMGGDLRYNLAALPNGNIAATYNTANGGAISILDSKNGSILSTEFFPQTTAPDGYVALYSTSKGDLYGIARNFPNTPIKILAATSPYSSTPIYLMRNPSAGFEKNGDLVLSAASNGSSNGQTTYDATIIKAADLPYLSTTFGNFSATTDTDTLTGTSFADTFAFGTAPNYSTNGSTSDVITNFNPTEGDLIKLSKSAFGISRGGLSPTFAQVNSASALTTQLGSSSQIVYDQSTGFLYNNQDGALTNGCGSGGGIFAFLTTKPTLSSSSLQFI